MINYRIFIAVIFTLIILLDKIASINSQTLLKNTKIHNLIMSVVYSVAIFYWVLSIFDLSIKWYAYLIAGIITFLYYIYYFFVNLYNKKTDEKPIEFKLDMFNDRIGIVSSKYDGGYIGNFIDTNELVFVHSIDILEENDKFKVTGIEGNKIMAIKIENNLNLNNKN